MASRVVAFAGNPARSRLLAREADEHRSIPDNPRQQEPVTMTNQMREAAGVMASGDRAQAEALRIAEAWLIKQGWRFTPADVGKRAREIIDAMLAAAQVEG